MLNIYIYVTTTFECTCVCVGILFVLGASLQQPVYNFRCVHPRAPAGVRNTGGWSI